MITKSTLVDQYEQILARGSLSPGQRNRLLRGEAVEGIVVQQSGGSSGVTPLRLPRTQSEMNWLAAKLLTRYPTEHGALPKRIAFLGGISHTEATARAQIERPVQIRDFSGDELVALDVFDPEVLSMYPSFAREIAANHTLRLKSLKAVKLGGEPTLPSDLRKLRDRFGDIAIVEQFGSTEMPGLAFRTHGPGIDTGYELSTDRYAFDFQPHQDWQPLIVRDRFVDRAFPIDDWFDTEDEVHVRDEVIHDVRRRDDPVYALLGPLDGLLRDGCVNVQILPHERLLLCSPGSSPPAMRVTLGEWKLDIRIEPPYRLVDSNKMPLLLDTHKVNRTRFYRRAGDESIDG